MERLDRVKSSNPCRICGSKRWCGYREYDGYTICVCMWVSEGSHGTARKGGWKHRIEGGSGTARAFRDFVEPERAPAGRRNVVYSNTLGLLDLSDSHREDLIDRGFEPSELAVLRYCTVSDVAGVLAHSGLDLNQVPGFFLLDDEWVMARYGQQNRLIDGFFVPVLDRRGRVQAMQIRTRWKTAKYVWFSSPERLRGASSGAPVHRRPSPGAPRLWLTEGPLKGDYLHLKLSVPVVALPGVWIGHDEAVSAALEPGVEEVVVAFDGNWRTNEQVARAMLSLLTDLARKTSARVLVAFWDGEIGIDNLLAAGERYEIAPAADWFRDHEATLAAIGDEMPDVLDRFRRDLGLERRLVA